MKIVHISDSHGKHNDIVVPECDLLLHTGDIGGRTTQQEVSDFLKWFEIQPASKKVFIGGNHDIVLDKNYYNTLKDSGKHTEADLHRQHWYNTMVEIDSYREKNVIYLNNTDYVYDGLKIYGSPYSPSFHRDYWVFNADRGNEIKNIWGRIPSDVDILLTHTPPYGILDNLGECADPGEDPHAGCGDLLQVIQKRLKQLKLHCFGHIHQNLRNGEFNYGVICHNITNTRRALFSNGSSLTNRYEPLGVNPLIITL